jgi:methyl-accepting chemotaxis protein
LQDDLDKLIEEVRENSQKITSLVKEQVTMANQVLVDEMTQTRSMLEKVLKYGKEPMLEIGQTTS